MRNFSLLRTKLPRIIPSWFEDKHRGRASIGQDAARRPRGSALSSEKLWVALSPTDLSLLLCVYCAHVTRGYRQRVVLRCALSPTPLGSSFYTIVRPGWSENFADISTNQV